MYVVTFPVAPVLREAAIENCFLEGLGRGK